MLRLVPAILAGVFLFVPKPAPDAQRGVLWRVVQTCIADHDLTGLAFPCLAVETGGGLDKGYVVLRAPFVKSHAIVSPTVRTIGIEAPRLRGSGAPDYFDDAWASRFYAMRGLVREPGRADTALAVNSRYGRSQDQLHIHIDCIRPKVKAVLEQDAARIVPGRWVQLRVMQYAPLWWATAVQGETLAGTNVLDLVADGLKIAQADMDEMTVVVVGSDDVGGKAGFVVLARQRLAHAYDEAHGEALMDHSCPAFR